MGAFGTVPFVRNEASAHVIEVSVQFPAVPITSRGISASGDVARVISSSAVSTYPGLGTSNRTSAIDVPS